LIGRRLALAAASPVSRSEPVITLGSRQIGTEPVVGRSPAPPRRFGRSTVDQVSCASDSGGLGFNRTTDGRTMADPCITWSIYRSPRTDGRTGGTCGAATVMSSRPPCVPPSYNRYRDFGMATADKIGITRPGRQTCRLLTETGASPLTSFATKLTARTNSAIEHLCTTSSTVSFILNL